MSKFDDAKNKARGKSADNASSAEDVLFSDVPILEPLSMEEFAREVQSGTGSLGERFLEISPGQQFRAFFLGTSNGKIEEGGKLKDVVRMHFELSTKDKKGTGVTFSLLEYAQLKSQISDVLPHDGSGYVMVGKGEMGQSKKKRQLQEWIVFRAADVRPPRARLTAGPVEPEKKAD